MYHLTRLFLQAAVAAPPAVMLLHGGELQLVVNTLRAATGPVVLDLGGRTFKGPLQGARPHVIELKHAGSVIRNGSLELPVDTYILVQAVGCRLDGLTINQRSGKRTAGRARCLLGSPNPWRVQGCGVVQQIATNTSL